MNPQSTYQQIADSIREEILNGVRAPGDKLPGVREMSNVWHCTPGTIQRAYEQLTQKGLLISRPGIGTIVSDGASKQASGHESLRNAALILRVEQFLLETISAGYTLEQVSRALPIAAEHWRVITDVPVAKDRNTILFYGSSDLVINSFVDELGLLVPNVNFHSQVAGSMAGIMALSQGKADMAGCHLWDRESNSYNLPFIHKLLPNQPVRVVTLANRRIGLITSSGNPLGIQSIQDLSRSGIRFINRQNGSGTRVWLDEQLSLAGIDHNRINGYDQEKSTHMEVARAIANGDADAGIGLESAAAELKLNFIPLTLERFDLVCMLEKSNQEPIRSFLLWLKSPAAREYIHKFIGYDTSHTGDIVE